MQSLPLTYKDVKNAISESITGNEMFFVYCDTISAKRRLVVDVRKRLFSKEIEVQVAGDGWVKPVRVFTDLPSIQ